MGRKIRTFDKDTIYFVTNSCFQRCFLMAPGEEVNRIILGCLARAVAIHHVQLFAFVFMSNHFHMLVKAPFMNLSEFMRDFQADIAREINRLRSRNGKFFSRRFSAEPILDEEALLDKLDYTLNNPCNDDLVRHIKHWPGVSSWDFHATSEPMVGKWLDRDELRRLRRKDENTPEEAAYKEFELELSTLPNFKDLTKKQAQQKVCEHIEPTATRLQKERADRQDKCMGPRKILATKWWDRPNDPKKSPRPLCHCSSAQERKAYREQLYETMDAYKKASGRWRDGETNISFPYGTIPPGHTRCIGAPPVPAPFADLSAEG